MKPERVVVGITGASGTIYGVRLLQALRALDLESHLVLSQAGALTAQQELGLSRAEIEALATRAYPPEAIGAAIASGSFATRGMIVAPCSMKSLAAIAHSHTTDLLARAADVTLKEGRPLILMVRETPLHLGHLRLMVQAAELGAVIFPPVPAFYNHPQSVEDIVQHTVGRVLARLGIANALYTPWEGPTI